MAQDSSAVAAAPVEHQNGTSGNVVVGFASFKPKLVLPSPKAGEAVQFYKAAFGAEEVLLVNYPKRKAEQELPLILSAELKISSASFLVCDQADDAATVKNGDGGIIFQLETEDVRGAVGNAVKAGAVMEGEIVEEEGPSGVAMYGKVRDPFGQVWAISALKKKCGEAEA